MSAYDDLLSGLGVALETRLTADENNTCRIQFDDEIYANVEPDRSEQFLIVGITLGTIPGGKGGEQLFRAALVENGLMRPPYATLAYSRKTNELVLFSQQRLAGLKGAKLLLQLNALVEKARVWRDAMRRGEIPPVERIVEEE